MADGSRQVFLAWTRLGKRLDHAHKRALPHVAAQERRIRRAVGLPPSRLRNYPR